ncbi:MAG: GatB/YqeY domain-containing protein [Verrucomicrobia bacterium]|nr:GatB/YqeY domain-containing protein [Verrucomicrobiota bacterium]
MTIQEEIDADLKDAMRSKQAERLSVLRMVKSALTNAAIEKHGAAGGLGDSEAVGVIRKQVKQRLDSIESFEKGGRPELADKERKEIEFLAEYLPKPLDENEIADLVKDAIGEARATSRAQLGAVMKIATEKAAGRVEGKKLSQAVQKALGG